jgi:hypothetical protein
MTETAKGQENWVQPFKFERLKGFFLAVTAGLISEKQGG